MSSHELYQYPIALDMHQNFAPRWNGRYLSSNVNITYTDSQGRLINTPVGDRFVKFRTKQYVDFASKQLKAQVENIW
jgi:hypothetical protein